jgi:hypothetical protein
VIILEPPSCGSTLVFIGKNNRGQWVAQEQNGLFGGLFVNRADAVRYALFENGRHPEAVVEIPGMLELDMNAPHGTPAQARALLPDQRRVA